MGQKSEKLLRCHPNYRSVAFAALDNVALLLQAFPTTFFIDKDGNIVDSIEGSNDYDGWKAKIDEVLKKVEANE